MKDGWHKVKGFDVLIEDDKIVRGIGEKWNEGLCPMYPYWYSDKLNCFVIATGVKVNTFRASEKYTMKF